jgi:hypothetical protein
MRKSKILLLALTLGTGLLLGTYFSSANAINDWQAGNIMEDTVMANSGSMNINQIQSFLDNRVPTCDTYGQQLSEFGGPDLNKDGKVQRWEWGKSKYNQTTFPCLKDYVQNNKKAAEIIYDTARKYTINPQVLIVLLQKEQGLVTDTWPVNLQYRSATGYGCPDTAPCDTQYYGLTNQLDWAAKMFRAILDDNPGWYTPYELGNNYIQYNPSSSCGGTTVNIRNRATQALYNYTPYQPNKGALDAGWGTSSCGAYGNRNFYLYFTSWFGSTRGTIEVGKITFENQSFVDSSTTVSFTLKNTTESKLALGNIRIAARGPANEWSDFSDVTNVTIDPGKTYTYRKSRILGASEGTYTFNIARYANGSWHYPPFEEYGQDKDGLVEKNFIKQPSLTSSLSIDSGAIHVGQEVTATFAIKNNSSQQLALGTVVAAARDPKNLWSDFPKAVNVSIAPNSIYEYKAKRKFSEVGKHDIWISHYSPTTGWSNSFPVATPASVIRKVSIVVKPSVTITTPLSIARPNAYAGNQVNGSFTIKNFGDKTEEIGYIKPAVRDSKGNNYDLPYSPYITLQPGETYTYDKSRSLKTGKYSIWIANKRNNHSWSKSFPESQDSSYVRSLSIDMN